MPPPLSSTLTARLRGLLPIIESGVVRGLSSRAINSAIQRATGTGIRRQVLLDVIRQVRGIQTAGDALRFVRLDRVPDPSRTPIALTPIRRALSSTVRVDGILLTTGERISRFVQVTHDDILTRGQIQDIAAGFIEGDVDEYGILLDSVILTRQVRRA